MNINWMDLIILMVLLWTAFWGWRSGLAEQSFQLVAILTGIFVSLRFTSYAVSYVQKWVTWSPGLVKILVFILLFVLAYLLVLLVKAWLSGMSHSDGVLYHLERLGGAFAAMFKSCILLFFALLVLGSLPSEPLRKEIKNETVIASRMIMVMPHVYGYMTASWEAPWINASRLWLDDMSRQFIRREVRKEEKKIFE